MEDDNKRLINITRENLEKIKIVFYLNNKEIPVISKTWKYIPFIQKYLEDFVKVLDWYEDKI